MTVHTLPSGAPDIISGTPHVGREVALKSILGLWAFYYVLNTIRMAIAQQPDQMGMLLRRAGVTAVGIALTFIMYLVLRRLEGRSLRTMVSAALVTSIPAAMIYAGVNFSAFYLVAPSATLMQEMVQMHAKHESYFNSILEQAVSWYFFLVSWGVLYVALSYAARVRQAERHAAAYRSQAQAAQLRALRYQVNPHFLFNTLNALSTLVLRQRTEEAENVIGNLATFFRHSLISDPAADVTLAEEIETQRLYLDIERVRFGDRLTVRIDVPEELKGAKIPAMILQPLIENAVKHGVARSRAPVTITIRAEANRGQIRVTIEDDAQDTTAAPAESGTGVGVGNVRERLAARFECAASLQYGVRPGGGFCVVVNIPQVLHD
jgi:LytS/YehU family sensor histidine kinase